MKYYIKNSLFGFVYLIIMDMATLLTAMVESTFWKAVLSVVAIGFYCFVVGTIYAKEGETAYDNLKKNDAERRRMVETGKLYDINVSSEYKPYKGFVIGAFICFPLALMLIFHLIIGLAAGSNTVGAIARLAYYTFFSIYGAFSESVTFGSYFIISYSVIITSLTCGIAYILGAKKSQRKYDLIELKHRQIYGDKN